MNVKIYVHTCTYVLPVSEGFSFLMLSIHPTLNLHLTFMHGVPVLYTIHSFIIVPQCQLTVFNGVLSNNRPIQ